MAEKVKTTFVYILYDHLDMGESEAHEIELTCAFLLYSVYLRNKSAENVPETCCSEIIFCKKRPENVFDLR